MSHRLADVGSTSSRNFPLAHALQPTLAIGEQYANDAFVAKLARMVLR
jgi:hypothetical protein